jgi:Cu-Zn family superoxide dismutase
LKNLSVAFLRVSLLSAVLVLAACGTGLGTVTPIAPSPSPQESRGAITTLESRSNSTTTGSATFTESDDKVTLELEVSGATPGLHGAHIHQTGDCSAADAASAGGHWNPAAVTHGPADPGHHLGDLGNLEIGQDGKGPLTVTKAAWKIGDGSPQDVVGKALVIHGGQDDLVTDPAGNSGSRVACGVITGKK